MSKQLKQILYSSVLKPIDLLGLNSITTWLCCNPESPAMEQSSVTWPFPCGCWIPIVLWSHTYTRPGETIYRQGETRGLSNSILCSALPSFSWHGRELADWAGRNFRGLRNPSRHSRVLIWYLYQLRDSRKVMRTGPVEAEKRNGGSTTAPTQRKVQSSRWDGTVLH